MDDRYGRLYELPAELAMLGHQVAGLCLSYRPREQGPSLTRTPKKNQVAWSSVNLGPFILPGLLRYFRKLKEIINDFHPDLIVAGSDALHCIFGQRIAEKHHLPCVLDLYDNFESFGLTLVPGISPLFRKAVAKAEGITCVSAQLERHVLTNYRPRGMVTTIVNAIPAELFQGKDKMIARQKLGLPAEAKLIGTAGALSKNRGIKTLIEAYNELAAHDPTIHLVLAGPQEPTIKLANDPKIHYLGELPYSEIPFLFSALDVGIICNVDSGFGRFCFPQKAYEMMACNLPVVAAGVGTMAELLSAFPEQLFSPGDVTGLVRAIRGQLTNPRQPEIPIVTWPQQAQKLLSFIEKIRP
ncbi:MAG: glycosyltransferase family 4 protein [Desulfobulbaceae bacterium]|nr:glycosyltransferase family 4 protein [Desulfobulbaceae bacterium]HIJ79884.1 glycosyltransferase family 4 protein [Deltaproteobacteria bacterium]